MRRSTSVWAPWREVAGKGLINLDIRLECDEGARVE
jgi:hypothetical protein